MPQVIGNKQKWKEAIEGLEVCRELAKQVLSQNGLHRSNDCLVKWIVASNFTGTCGITSWSPAIRASPFRRSWGPMAARR